MTRSSSRELDRVDRLFAQWRARYPKGKRPPEALWTEAVALLDHLPLAEVASRLGLRPARLAARRAAPASSAVAAHATPPARMLELTAPRMAAPLPLTSAPECLLQIERPDGCRLQLAIERADAQILATLCRAFADAS